ncbi:ROK family protein [Leptolyngbya sp. FACHB-261]|uniref:ROK family protein n=1 Tax=Leptolyngbya sp. FACHB-261 TaxID=2692806 RepID=UPI001686DE3B|nr:ROK family protein [Leptolyngbya sp. FACHB-261]MBD2100525.1 ROK family protein [Leptolyngbya sp. FACHB-261]
MIVLCIDIGGSGLKGALVNEQCEMVSERLRCETPQPASPEPVLAALTTLLKPMKGYERIAVGFPGVVTEGITRTAHNLHPEWQDFPLAERLSQVFDVPTRVANDADVQGYGAVAGKGVELVITLGTGCGSALFTEGQLVPNLEMGHHPFRKDKTYEELLGDAARQESKKDWNRNLELAIEQWRKLFSFTRLYLGGGNASKIKFDLPVDVEVVSNQAGIYGGVALWLGPRFKS